MGLQLRLTHSLGDRLIDVESRGSDQPIVVGRGSAAEVQVPSANIAKRHCLLFVHEGHWVVQDTGSPGGTLLNGVPVGNPAFVGSGDVIALGGGSDPPTIVVDPHSLGVTEEVEAEPVAASSGRASAVPPAVSQPEVVPAPPAYDLPPPPPRMPPPQQGLPRPGYAPGLPLPGYGAAAAQPAPAAPHGWEGVRRASKYYVPKRKGNSPAVVGAVVVMALIVVVGGGYWAYNATQAALQRQLEASKTKVIEQPSKDDGGPKGSGNIFGDMSVRMPTTRVIVLRAPAATGATTTATATTTPVAAKPEAMEEAEDPRKLDPEWRDLAMSRYGNPVLTIVKIKAYKDTHPNTPNKKDLDLYVAEALDRLWWKRLKELFAERDGFQKEVTDRKLQISQSKDAAFKAMLEKEIPPLIERRDRAQKAIVEEMKFKREEPPDPNDAADVKALRPWRDEAVFADWGRRVQGAAERSRGQELPWGAVR